ncbi:MAG: DHA2 family efflux MFS transporter permease subunit, partial [Burkholderiales bacterium]
MPRESNPARWPLVFGGLLGAMSTVLSATMVNVAVPSIMGAFGVGQDLAQWAATAFLATMVASQLLNTWAVQAFGQRNAFCTALVVFALGALIGAGAPNIETLVFGRILQGFAAGLVQPLVLTAVVNAFPPERRGLAVGIYGMAVTLAPSFGPWIGGLAIDALSWREMFLVPLPLVAVAFLLGLLTMPGKTFSWRLPPFDWAGYALVSVALLGVMSAIGNGQRWGWSSSETLIAFAVGAGAALAFVAAQRRSANPLLDVSLFADLRFTSAMLIAFAFGAGNFATNYAIPVFTQTVQGFTATDAGAILLPAGMLLVVLIPLSGRLADNFPAHVPIMAGCVLFAIAAWLMSDSDVNTAFWTLAAFAVVSRLALGLVMPNMGKVAMTAVPAGKLNQAAGTYNFIRQLGGAFGVNLTAVSLELSTARHADLLTSTQTPDNAQSMELLARVGELMHRAGVPDAVLGPGALDYLGDVIYAQALGLGFQDAFFQI